MPSTRSIPLPKLYTRNAAAGCRQSTASTQEATLVNHSSSPVAPTPCEAFVNIIKAAAPLDIDEHGFAFNIVSKLPRPTWQNNGSSKSKSLQLASESDEPSLDTMMAWNRMTKPNGLPTSMATNNELLRVGGEICDALSSLHKFRKETGELVESIRESAKHDAELDMPVSSTQIQITDDVRSSDRTSASSCSTPSMDHAPSSPTQSVGHLPSSPPLLRPLPIPPVNHEDMPYEEDTLYTNVRGMELLEVEDDHAEETGLILNELKWGLKVDASTCEITSLELDAFDPDDPERELQPVHVMAGWAHAILVMENLFDQSINIIEGTRKGIELVHGENFLLKRRVHELEVEVGDLKALKEQVAVLDAKLGIIIMNGNEGMINDTSTRMADESLHRVSQSLQSPVKSQAPVKVPASHGKLPQARRALSTIEPNNQPNLLRRQFISNDQTTTKQKRKQLDQEFFSMSAGTDENMEANLLACREIRDIANRNRKSNILKPHLTEVSHVQHK
jgi:hypothetical protein